jgi:hypothetical protein
MPVEYLTPSIENRAVAIQHALADRGEHRAPSIPDLPIAATAEATQLTGLHQNKDFDLISGHTQQPVERLNRDQTPKPQLPYTLASKTMKSSSLVGGRSSCSP